MNQQLKKWLGIAGGEVFRGVCLGFGIGIGLLPLLFVALSLLSSQANGEIKIPEHRARQMLQGEDSIFYQAPEKLLAQTPDNSPSASQPKPASPTKAAPASKASKTTAKSVPLKPFAPIKSSDAKGEAWKEWDIPTIEISDVNQFHNAINRLNQSREGAVLKFNKGTYTVRKTVYIKADKIVLTSESGNPHDVVIRGHGMLNKKTNVLNLLRVSGSDFVVDGVTLKDARNHLIQIAGERDADRPIIRNCILEDGFQQLVKVSYDKRKAPELSSDYGIVENCIFRYTQGIGPNHYIGGLDAHAIRNWVVRNNQFYNIASPRNAVAEHAVHIWNNSSNNIVENNLIVDSDRGIGFGMRQKKKQHTEEHKNIVYGNLAGVIRNNLIVHTDNDHPFADVGIIIEDSPNTLIENNRVFMRHGYPNAIEYRFEQTVDAKITNNRVNRRIKARNGGKAELSGNSTEVPETEVKKVFAELGLDY